MAMAADPVSTDLEGLGWHVVRGCLSFASLDVLCSMTAVLPTDVSGRWISTAILETIGPNDRLQLDRSIRAIVDPVIDCVLPGHRSFMASMFTKGSGGPEVPFHQDLTYSNEQASLRSYVAWIPLVDVTEENGALQLVSRSHRWTTGVRAMGPGGIRPLQDEHDALAAACTTVELAIGDMLLFDVAIAHASHANQSDHDRPAVAVNLNPIGCTPTIYHRSASGMLERFVIGGDYLGDPTPFRSRPTGYEQVEVGPSPDPVTTLPSH